MKFAYNKVNETGLSLSVADTAAGEPVVITVENSNGDFLKNLKSVKLGDDAVYGKGVEGSDEVYYVLSADNKTISLHNVKPGSYQLTLSAEYYENLTAKFTMAGEVSVHPVPNANPTVELKDGIYRLHFGDVEFGWWNYAKTITVKGHSYEYNNMYPFYSLSDNQFGWTTENAADYSNDRILALSASAFEDGDNTVAISADGYETLTVTVTKTASGGSTEPTEPTDPTKPGESEVKVPTELPTITKGSNAYCTLAFSNAEKWLAQNLTVTVNDVVYDKTGSIYNLDNGGAYYIEENKISLKIPYETFDTKTSTLVISDGTSTINFTVTMPGSFSFGAEPTIAFTK